MSAPTTIVVGRHWHEDQSEIAFVTRSLAGALSRISDITVLAPGPRGARHPDGAFDVIGMGEEATDDVPHDLPGGCRVFVDDASAELFPLLSRLTPAAVWYVTMSDPATELGWRRLGLVGEHAAPGGTYVRVNPAAEQQRHHGFGFTGYLLVLSDGVSGTAAPPAAAAWLSAAFPQRDVLVVGAGIASAWRGRSLRGTASVDTRMDLWRLLAHADLCIDLDPGRFIARECVEALRFGTPIIVPSGCGPAAVHAQASGGFTFAGPRDLIAAVAALQPQEARAAASAAGRRYADSHHGDPGTLVTSLRSLVSGP